MSFNTKFGAYLKTLNFSFLRTVHANTTKMQLFGMQLVVLLLAQKLQLLMLLQAKMLSQLVSMFQTTFNYTNQVSMLAQLMKTVQAQITQSQLLVMT